MMLMKVSGQIIATPTHMTAELAVQGQCQLQRRQPVQKMHKARPQQLLHAFLRGERKVRRHRHCFCLLFTFPKKPSKGKLLENQAHMFDVVLCRKTIALLFWIDLHGEVCGHAFNICPFRWVSLFDMSGSFLSSSKGLTAGQALSTDVLQDVRVI
jgi:hypothetical protein